MQVVLFNHKPLSLIVFAARTSRDSFKHSDTFNNVKKYYNTDALGEKDIKLIKSLIKMGHESVLEHVDYTFFIEKISRLCLQELVRHRISSYTVRSTRYTLRSFRNLDRFEPEDLYKYVNTKYLSDFEKQGLFLILQYIKHNNNKIPNDIIKYLLPEAFYTELIFTINARSLRNFLKLRTHKSAHPEIRELAYKIYDILPQEHKFMYEDVVYKKED